MLHLTEQDVADARLIAAAPDLLAAVRLVVDAWDGNENADDIEWGEITDTARAAIAKAEGTDNG